MDRRMDGWIDAYINIDYEEKIWSKNKIKIKHLFKVELVTRSNV